MRRAAAIALTVTRATALFGLFGLLPITVALADVYRSVDAQGHVEYSDTPTPGAELVHVKNLGAQPTTSSLTSSSLTASAASAPAAQPGKSGDPVHDQLAQQAAQQAVANDVAARRAEQCTKATNDYNSSVQARRIYRAGTDGEREYLSDAEADEQRTNLRLAMEAACSTP